MTPVRIELNSLVPLCLVLALFFAGCSPSTLTVSNAKFEPPMNGGDVGLAYFTIESPKADRIVKLSSPAARAVEMHAMEMKGAMMTMKRLESVDLPAGQKVEFKPSGMHLMVFSPQPIGADATIPITIELQSGITKTVQFLASKRG